MARLTVVRDKAEMSAAAADRITSLIEGAIVIRTTAAVSLTGGTTPDQLYGFLADPDRPWRARIDWTRVHVFWSDERNVPPDHPESNFGLANRTLIRHVPIPASQVHRIRGELPAVDAGGEYDELLRARRGRVVGRLFDVMLLGIGTDAHIASIFPESPLLVRGPAGSAPHAQPDSSGAHGLVGPRQLAAGVWVPKLNQWRITLTPPALLDSAAVMVIAAGPQKADAVEKAIAGDMDVARYPAQLLRGSDERVEWIIDEAAARSVSPRRAV
jgi:6-phosphogluconolactonase